MASAKAPHLRQELHPPKIEPYPYTPWKTMQFLCTSGPLRLRVNTLLNRYASLLLAVPRQRRDILLPKLQVDVELEEGTGSEFTHPRHDPFLVRFLIQPNV